MRLVNTTWADDDAPSPRQDVPGRSIREVREAPRASGVSLAIADARWPSRDQVDAVALENASAARSAAMLTPGDARWVFAVRVASAFDANPAGSPRGMLDPQTREKLLHAAKLLHLRPFDAALIISILQDSARRGLHPLGPDAASRLELVPPANTRTQPSTSRLNIALAACSAAMLGMAMLTTLIGWVLRG